MASTQPRHGDIVIQRPSTHEVKQVYAVTYPGHTDQGTERESYDDAERMALELAKEKRLSVWYEENPQSGRKTLVKSFRETHSPSASYWSRTMTSQLSLSQVLRSESSASTQSMRMSLAA